MTKRPTLLKKRALLATSIILGTMWLAGCNTTQEIRPTASVMVGAHKSL